MPLDLETIFALHTMRQLGHGAGTLVEEDLLEEKDEDLCPTCGTLMFEDDSEPFALLCPICDIGAD